MYCVCVPMYFDDMATSGTGNDELTSCPICFETFTKPKFLPCLHSFCEGCISTFIVSAFDKDSSSKGINCPICRSFVPKPGHVDSGKWAEYLPVNHLLVSIIDFNNAKKGSKNCHICERENKTKSAHVWCVDCREAMCEFCEHQHKRFKQIENHKIVTLTDLDSTETPIPSGDMYCLDHPDKRVEAYCSDHSVVCCISCVTIKHRKCDSVGTIEDAAKSLRNSDEINKLEKSFNNMSETLTNMEKDRAENLKGIESETNKIRNTILKLYDNASKHLESLKNNALEEFRAVEKDVTPEIQNWIDGIRGKACAIRNNQKILQTSKQHGCDAQLLQDFTNLKAQKEDIGNFILEQGKTMKNIRLNFNSNQDFLNFSKSVPTLGKVEIERKKVGESGAGSLPSINMLTVVPTYFKEKSYSDHIIGVNFLGNNQIIISNSDKKTIDLLDFDLNVLSSLSVPGRPCGIKMIDNTRGAVTLQGKCLVLFTARYNRLMQEKRVPVECSYDFDYHDGTYYIGGKGRIVVLDSDHRHLRDITVNGIVRSLSLRNDHTLCYTVNNGKILYCIGTDGSPVFQYKHEKLMDTEGITIDFMSNIYVCCYRTNSVHQVSNEGNFVRLIIPDAKKNPRSIRFNHKYDKVVIRCYQKLYLYSL